MDILPHSTRNVFLFSDLMLLLVHVTFAQLSEDARSLHLEQANISLHYQKLQNDGFLRPLKKTQKNHFLQLC